VVLDNLATGFDWAVAQGALLVIGDAGNQSLVATLIAKHRIDAIIHFAGSVVVADSVRDPLGYYRNNTVNSRVLIETAVKEGVRHFSFSSTCAVYGNPERVPAREEDATVPTSPRMIGLSTSVENSVSTVSIVSAARSNGSRGDQASLSSSRRKVYATNGPPARIGALPPLRYPIDPSPLKSSFEPHLRIR
jgi:UDP-glucose 4-epimerase